jgi:hypothetical protein
VLFGNVKPMELPTLKQSPLKSTAEDLTGILPGLQEGLAQIRQARIDAAKEAGRQALQQQAGRPDRGPGPPMVPIETQDTLAAAVAELRIERGGALQMFQRLQDSLAPKKGEELQKKQIELAKESLEVQRAIATGLTGIPLVPILG